MTYNASVVSFVSFKIGEQERPYVFSLTREGEEEDPLLGKGELQLFALSAL